MLINFVHNRRIDGLLTELSWARGWEAVILLMDNKLK